MLSENQGYAETNVVTDFQSGGYHSLFKKRNRWYYWICGHPIDIRIESKTRDIYALFYSNNIFN